MFSNNMFSNNMFSSTMFSSAMFSCTMFSSTMFSSTIFSSTMFSNTLFSSNRCWLHCVAGACVAAVSAQAPCCTSPSAVRRWPAAVRLHEQVCEVHQPCKGSDLGDRVTTSNEMGSVWSYEACTGRSSLCTLLRCVLFCCLCYASWCAHYMYLPSAYCGVICCGNGTGNSRALGLWLHSGVRV